MPQDGGAEQAAPAAGRWQHHREPRTFAGKSDEDVDEWLTNYERVSRYNGWDATVRLANVVFFLEATALIWFDNHEDSLTMWERFIEEIKKCFGDGSAKKKRAEQTLLQRAQLPGETCTMYIEEIVMLCRLVNPRMSEEDRVGHLLKGIAEDVYNFLISKDSLKSTADVIKHCRAFEALKLRRIVPKFGRLANVTSIASVDVAAPVSMANMIRQIVREELLRYQDPVRRDDAQQDGCAFQTEPATPSTSWVPAGVSQNFADRRPREVQSAYQSVGRRRSYTGDLARQQPRDDYNQRSDHAWQASYVDRWRPPPVCYRCGMTGHISRYCRRRGPLHPDHRQWPNTSLNPDAAVQHPTPTSSWGSYRAALLRNTSPASDRCLTPPPSRQRRSPSPRRRSPPPGN
ncbi:uncharacterized protein LOC144129553 [Amblyomma americanum]